MLAHVHQIPTLLIKTAEIPRTREVSAGSRRINTVPRKNGVLVKNCQPRETFVAPRPDVRTRFRPKKTVRNRINAKFSRVGTFVRYTTRDVLSKSGFAERRRVFMSCMPKHFSSTFDHSGRNTSMSFVFHTHDLTNILRKRLIQQQGVERDRIC